MAISSRLKTKVGSYSIDFLGEGEQNEIMAESNLVGHTCCPYLINWLLVLMFELDLTRPFDWTLLMCSEAVFSEPVHPSICHLLWFWPTHLFGVVSLIHVQFFMALIYGYTNCPLHCANVHIFIWITIHCAFSAPFYIYACSATFFLEWIQIYLTREGEEESSFPLKSQHWKIKSSSVIYVRCQCYPFTIVIQIWEGVEATTMQECVSVCLCVCVCLCLLIVGLLDHLPHKIIETNNQTAYTVTKHYRSMPDSRKIA